MAYSLSLCLCLCQRQCHCQDSKPVPVPVPRCDQLERSPWEKHRMRQKRKRKRGEEEEGEEGQSPTNKRWERQGRCAISPLLFRTLTQFSRMTRQQLSHSPQPFQRHPRLCFIPAPLALPQDSRAISRDCQRSTPRNLMLLKSLITFQIINPNAMNLP